nr:glycosyltransferase family 4 protein [Bacteroidales bacterium]
VTSDEAFTKKSLKQFIRKWRFRLLIAPLFDKVFVVGAGGKKHFIDYYGLSPERVFTGLYGSDPKLFFNGPPLKERPKRFIYVGHYDANKNVLAMCTAFEQAVAHLGESGWTLDIYGGGELEGELKKRESEHVHIHGFIQAEQLGALYRDARGFVLGSFSDKWGVVVHEAAASGCLLLLSTAVGAHYDFARPENSALFDPASVEEFQQGFEKLMTMPEEKLEAAQALSVQLAQGFSPEIFAQSLMSALQ